MDAENLSIEGCPNWRKAGALLRGALELAGRSEDVIRYRLLSSAEERERAHLGLPALLLDGVDPFAAGATTTDLASRLYWTAAGAAGAPSVGQLVETLRRGRASVQ